MMDLWWNLLKTHVLQWLYVEGVLLHQDSVCQVRQLHPPRSQTEFDQIKMGLFIWTKNISLRKKFMKLDYLNNTQTFGFQWHSSITISGGYHWEWFWNKNVKTYYNRTHKTFPVTVLWMALLSFAPKLNSSLKM